MSFFCPDIWWLNLKFPPFHPQLIIHVLLLATLSITCMFKVFNCLSTPKLSLVLSQQIHTFQDRDALTQTILINNCCFSLVSKFFSYTVTLAHCLWWLLICTRTWHLWLSPIIFITGSNCLDTSTFYFPFSTQTRLLFHSNTYILGDCTTSPPSPFFLYISTNPLSTYRFPLYSQGH